MTDKTIDRALRHGNAPDPFGYIRKPTDCKMTDIGPRLTQDVLLLAAGRHHFIPASLYQERKTPCQTSFETADSLKGQFGTLYAECRVQTVNSMVSFVFRKKTRNPDSTDLEEREPAIRR